jgi:hypothetical protein
MAPIASGEANLVAAAGMNFAVRWPTIIVSAAPANASFRRAG